MRRLADERGVTLTELLVAMTIALAGFGMVLTVVEVFLRDSAAAQRTNEAQDLARSTIDRLAVDVRNAIAAPGLAPAVVERTGPYDLVFQTVDPRRVAGGSNTINAMRVRYCLGGSSSNGILYLQSQRWTTATAPPIGDTTACPGTTGWDGAPRAVVTNLTNRAQADPANRPVWATEPSAPATPAEIATINTNLIVNLSPGARRSERRLQGGVSLRNANRPPTAAFTVNQVRGHVITNATSSTDPDGDPLAYQWYVNGVERVGENSPQLDVQGLAPGSTHTFRLRVTDSGKLTATSELTVTVQP